MRHLLISAVLFLSVPHAFAQCGDDAFEDNDSIGAAVRIAPGSYPGLVVTSSQSACGVDEDYYRIDVADGMAVRVDIAFDASLGRIQPFLYDAVGGFPNTWVARGTTSLSFPNHTGQTQTYWIAIDVANVFDTIVYDLDVAVFPDPCAGAADDPFEPNDDLSSPAPITLGVHVGLHMSDTNEDYYSIDLPAGQVVRVTAHATFDPAAVHALSLRVSGTNQGVTSLSGGDVRSLLFTNTSGATQPLTLGAFILTGSVGVCVDYDLTIEMFPDPCLTLIQDRFEDNEECSEAPFVGPGTYSGLTVERSDLDLFRTLVPAGETLTVQLFFDHSQGNIDMDSFDPGLECTHIVEQFGTSLTDNEMITTTNLTGQDVEYFWRIFNQNIHGGTLRCNTYTMVVNVTGQTGNSFCDASDGALALCPCGNPGTPEAGCDISHGTGGIALVITGQESSPQNRATLVGTGYPAMGAPGVTVIRSNALDPASPVVFGDGLRCIGLPVVRVGAVLASGGTSTQTVGHGAGAGTGTFYYQLWLRNTPSMFCTPDAFNLSNGRTIVW
jgi:hypothetical protein